MQKIKQKPRSSRTPNMARAKKAPYFGPLKRFPPLGPSVRGPWCIHSVFALLCRGPDPSAPVLSWLLTAQKSPDSVFTECRHARIHHPPRGIQAACGQIKASEYPPPLSPLSRSLSPQSYGSTAPTALTYFVLWSRGCSPCPSLSTLSLPLRLSPSLPLSAPILRRLCTAQRSPEAFLVHRMSPCTHPPCTKRHARRCAHLKHWSKDRLCPALVLSSDIGHTVPLSLSPFCAAQTLE